MPTSRTRSLVIAALLVSGAVGVGCVALKLPLPAIDDLFYTGAAIELAQHGRLANPWLAGQQFPTDRFLIYPPVYQWILAGWLAIWGVSTVALLAFQNLCYAVFGLAYSRLLARYGVHPHGSWAWPALFAIGVLASLGTMGLRPDACGFALLVCGFLLRVDRAAGRKLAGWTLIALSMAVSPNVLPYAFVAICLALAADRRAQRLDRFEWLPAIGGCTGAIAIFIASIGGRLIEFTHAFLFHATRAVAPVGEAFTLGLQRVWSRDRQHPYYFFAIVLVAAIASLAWRRRDYRVAGFSGLVLASAATFLAGLGSVGMTWIRDELRLFTVVIWSLTILCWMAARPDLRRVAAIGLCAIAACATWQAMPMAAYLLRGPGPSAAQIARARAAVEREPDRTFLIDAWAAREVFDYHLPPNSRDWSFSQPFPGLWPQSIHQLRPTETWIISGSSLRMIEPSRLPGLTVAFRFAGRQLCYFPAERAVFTIDGRSPVINAGRPAL